METIEFFSLLSNKLYHEIYRNIYISYITIDNFKNDIINTAREHIENNNNPSKNSLDLSIAYVLEEIAINLRIRVVENVYDEYYMGKLPKPLIDLYSGKYGIDIFKVCNKKNKDVTFNFYHSPFYNPSNYWVEIK